MKIETPGYTIREQRLQWTNTIVQLHDMLCKCNKPLEHTIDNILSQEPNLRLEETTKLKIQKCLTTTTDGDRVGDADILEDGDLDALFATDFTEEETG